MKLRTRSILRWAGYPAFYAASLVVFIYLTFPFERLKERLVAEFNSKQTSGMRLEVDDMSWYWLSGVEASGIRLTIPPGDSSGADAAKPKKPRVVTVDHAHVRVGILRLLFGTTDVSFGADALGGHISGDVVDTDAERDIDVTLEDVDVGMLPFMRDMVGLPMTGALSGDVELKLPAQKLAKADGKVDLKLASLTVGDGKAKIRDAIALPKLNAGELVLKADISGGRVDVKQFGAKGPDVEVVSDGKIRLRDPFGASLAELGLRFRFADKYKNKNDTTRSLFGAPGSKMPALFDLDPKIKRAKRPDGFYAWRITGPFEHLLFEPAPAVGGRPLPATGGVMRGFPGMR